MILEILGLILIPLLLAVVLSIAGIAIVRALTDSQGRPSELLWPTIGMVVGGGVGLLVSATGAFMAGLIPLFPHDPANPAAASLIIFPATIFFAWIGARLGGLYARHSALRRYRPY